MIYTTETTCRACGSSSLEDLIAFGMTPLADRILRQDQLNEPEPEAPLTLARCIGCSLVQIRETVDPRILFYAEYPYFSSVSPALRKHFEGNSIEVFQRQILNETSLVIEAASNDGCLLRNFHVRGIPVMGIDPAEAPVKRARQQGIRTMCEFFNDDLAQELAADCQQADVFLANNVLAHVADLNGFVRGIETILKPDGLAVLEMPYLVDLVHHCEFDTIYHQHLCYFSLISIDRLFRKAGLFINEVQHIGIHGGSLRIFARKKNSPDASVTAMLLKEEEDGVASGAVMKAFSRDVRDLRERLSGKLFELKASGKQLAGYGAAGKATTLLSYCGIDSSVLDFVADLNDYKHGKFMGGNHLPIVPVSEIYRRKPDVLVILAWNFAREIMEQLEDYRKSGGLFLIPIPDVSIV